MTEFEVALFKRCPQLGEVNPPGEVRYVGYARVPFDLVVAHMAHNMPPLAFSPVQQDEPVFVACVVLLDAYGTVHGVISANYLLHTGMGATIRMKTVSR